MLLGLDLFGYVQLPLRQTYDKKPPKKRTIF